MDKAHRSLLDEIEAMRQRLRKEEEAEKASSGHKSLGEQLADDDDGGAGTAARSHLALTAAMRLFISGSIEARADGNRRGPIPLTFCIAAVHCWLGVTIARSLTLYRTMLTTSPAPNSPS